ncbi:MAG: class I SAM-dependent methyltransferase, partial [Candidatus Erginobacter occultus]|nr:class I SAM-dependent methyltransferase [Candidatus Erginobacter occultus]
DADLNTEMEAYLHALEECRFGRSPRGVFSSGAGNEMYSPAAHLAFNAPAYLFAGLLIRREQISGDLLDLGCGSGYDISYLKQKFVPKVRVTGSDRSLPQLDYAARHYAQRGLIFGCGDNLHLPFKGESFSAVIAIFSILHNTDPPRALDCLKEISRILKPNGCLIFSTPNREVFQNLYHENPKNDPQFRFISRFPHVYTREALEAFLMGLTRGDVKLFETVSVTGLANTGFRPAWEATVALMRKARFGRSGGVSLLSSLSRRFLPTGLGAWYFYMVLKNVLKRSGISLADIARSPRTYPEKDGIQPDQFIVVARKGKHGA